MILLIAVFIGTIAGLVRARVNKREYQFDDLRAPWLVVAAFVPQLFAFNIPSTSQKTSDPLASVLLVSTQALLLVFALLNIKKLSFWPIFTGFLANFIVITLNGGLMPISPKTIERMSPASDGFVYQVGARLGSGRDVVLPESSTRLAFLSDRIVLNLLGQFSVAFSAGDILISLGVIWLLWSLGSPVKNRISEKI
jgi:hypothetical protein